MACCDVSGILPFCTPVLIGPHDAPLLSFNRFSVGSEKKDNK